jgi:hypothetical protein
MTGGTGCTPPRSADECRASTWCHRASNGRFWRSQAWAAGVKVRSDECRAASNAAFEAEKADFGGYDAIDWRNSLVFEAYVGTIGPRDTTIARPNGRFEASDTTKWGCDTTIDRGNTRFGACDTTIAKPIVVLHRSSARLYPPSVCSHRRTACSDRPWARSHRPSDRSHRPSAVSSGPSGRLGRSPVVSARPSTVLHTPSTWLRECRTDRAGRGSTGDSWG